MGRVEGHGYHVFLGVALLTLAALGVWWTVFIRGAVELEREAQLGRLCNAARLEAVRAGHGASPPVPGPIVDQPGLEWVPSSACAETDRCCQALPRYPGMSVRPATAALAAIDDKNARRRVMIIGEGTLLFVLLGVCTAMLYRLVRQERRNRRAMETFVSAFTHEMKTPLAGIKSLLQTLSVGRVPDEQQPRLLALGLRETERLQHSIENVLLEGSLRTHRLEVRLEPVDLRALLEAFLEHRRPALVDDPDAVCLEWELGPDPGPVHADPSAVRVILENLTDNALKYGGARPRVTLRVQYDGGRIGIAVEDQGIGFDQRAAEGLFGAFRRGRQARDAVEHGTGLGLAIARTLARRMGGDLTGSSPGPGRGSVFTLILPATPGAAP